MMLLLLAFIGSLEGVVYLIRYRTAVGRSATASASSAFCLAVMRVMFLLAGVSVILKESNWAVAVIAYALPAAVATWLAHEALERRAERLYYQ